MTPCKVNKFTKQAFCQEVQLPACS
jgi:hypothetical protein